MPALSLGTATILSRSKWSNKKVNIVDIAFSGDYATGGFAVTAAKCGLVSLEHALLLDPNVGGYLAGFETTSNLVKLYNPVTAHTHAVALDSGASAAGASHNHAFTGTEPISSLNLATPAFSGTGLTAAGQVMTTTNNQTMTLNQCAGMWLIPATGATPPMLILSNTAVTGAQAVLTVQGAAATDAGAYKIVKHLAPVGTNAAEATHTHASGTLADAASGAATVGAGSEVANGTTITSQTMTVLAIGV